MYTVCIHAQLSFGDIARFEGDDGAPTDASLRTADRDVRTLQAQGLRIEAADWRLAVEVKAPGCIALADAFALALAHRCEATLVAGGDDDFDGLPVVVDVKRFRDQEVSDRRGRRCARSGYQ